MVYFSVSLTVFMTPFKAQVLTMQAAPLWGYRKRETSDPTESSAQAEGLLRLRRAAPRSLLFLSAQSKAEGRKAAEPGPILRGWVVARTSPPPCRFGSLLSSVILDKAAGSCFVIPSGKTHVIKHVSMSLQFLNLLFKSPIHYHCIGLIIDFQQRLTCNRRSNCAFHFRDCSFPAGNSRRIWWN